VTSAKQFYPAREETMVTAYTIHQLQDKNSFPKFISNDTRAYSSRISFKTVTSYRAQSPGKYEVPMAPSAIGTDAIGTISGKFDYFGISGAQ
jgi:hypothetical protein